LGEEEGENIRKRRGRSCRKRKSIRGERGNRREGTKICRKRKKRN
jgi:hypothetical protein